MFNQKPNMKHDGKTSYNKKLPLKLKKLSNGDFLLIQQKESLYEGDLKNMDNFLSDVGFPYYISGGKLFKYGTKRSRDHLANFDLSSGHIRALNN